MKPIYLYIKQHNKTGLKYFGKTTQNPFTYRGSGLYWNRHLKKHGNDVTTIWTKAFDNIDEINHYALRFSIENNIVESTNWANMKCENGLDGGRDSGFEGREISKEERIILSERMKNNNPMRDPEIKKKHAESMKSDIRRKKLSIAKTGNKNTKGKTWYNNGITTKMFHEPPDQTWTKGRLNPHWNHKRKINED